jgi:hypothetical protein
LKWKKKTKKLEESNELYIMKLKVKREENEPDEVAVKGEERVMVKEERKWDCGEGER